MEVIQRQGLDQDENMMQVMWFKNYNNDFDGICG